MLLRARWSSLVKSEENGRATECAPRSARVREELLEQVSEMRCVGPVSQKRADRHSKLVHSYRRG